MAMNVDEAQDAAALEARLKAILPEPYQDSYEDVQPVSMGSAGLKYGMDGKVAWDEIWATFCDLAMAGGPPHKGALLEPASPAAIDAEPERYREVVAEICRGVAMVTDLAVEPSPVSGWVRVTCLGEGMAGWLLRAIAMENVSVRSERRTLDLPAGPRYRLEKEIKNVVTVIAKTCHYWLGHMPRDRQRDVEALFAAMAAASPLVVPEPASGRRAVGDEATASIAAAIHARTGLRSSGHRYAGWLGVECSAVRAAVSMMRALVACNVLSRREATVLFVPVNPVTDPGGGIVAAAVTRVHRLAAARGLF